LALVPFVLAPFAFVTLGPVAAPLPFAGPAFVVADALAVLVAGAVAEGPLASLCWLVCEAEAGGGGGADAVASSRAANGCDVVSWIAAVCDHCVGA
jgi:hypothetical protein